MIKLFGFITICLFFSSCATAKVSATFNSFPKPVLLGCISKIGESVSQCVTEKQNNFYTSIKHYIDRDSSSRREGTNKLTKDGLKAITGHKDVDILVNTLKLSVFNFNFGYDIMFVQNKISIGGTVQKPGAEKVSHNE